jgi:hypothetical protein
LVFAVFVMLGVALFNRVGNGVPIVILAAAGAYAGWLVGVIVFGAVRGSSGINDQEEQN